VTLDRLESWRNGHKSRSVQIGIDNGYGATCWEVELWGNQKHVVAAEVSFWKNEAESATPNVVFVGDVDGGWPGLRRTIEAALDRADELGL